MRGGSVVCSSSMFVKSGEYNIERWSQVRRKGSQWDCELEIVVLST